jgi:site-specific recombinase XerD
VYAFKLFGKSDDALELLQMSSLAIPYAVSKTTRKRRAIVSPSATRLSKNTLLAYRSDWKRFKEWCGDTGVSHLSATPGDIISYLHCEKDRGCSPGFLTRKVAALLEGFKSAGVKSPTGSPEVKAAVAALNRLGKSRVRTVPVNSQIIERMAETCGDDLSGLRNKAILGLLFETGLGRTAVAAICADDISHVASETRISALGMETPITLPTDGLASKALNDWIEAAGIEDGPLFQSVNKAGRLMRGVALAGHSINRIVKNAAKDAGIDPERVSSRCITAAHRIKDMNATIDAAWQ